MLLAVALHSAVAFQFWGIKSGVSEVYRQRRQDWRSSECAKRYERLNIRWKFFVGVPLDKGKLLDGRSQSAFASDQEVADANALVNENKEFGDLHVLPMRDLYMDNSNKLIGIIAYGYWFTNASFIGAHDDEYCLTPEIITMASTAHHTAPYVYGGHYLWKGDEYTQMRGRNGMRSPFFNGMALFLSRELVKHAIIENWDDVVLYLEYGTSADDANMGKWVTRAMHRRGIRVKMAHGNVVEIVDHGKLLRDRA